VNLSTKALAGGKGSSVATWILERRFREDYGPVNRIDQTIDLTMQKLLKAFDPPAEDAEPPNEIDE
jgi:20S proteasome alpha/beta subunit